MQTRTSHNWKFRCGTWDSLKTRFINFTDYPEIGSTFDIEPDTEQVKCLDLNKIKDNSLIDMFVDDYRLERYWNRVEYYRDIFAQARYVMSPDFSTLIGMPEDMIKWNIYRSRLLGFVYEQHNITVIPTVTWADESTFSYCCRGIRKNSVIAVSNIGATNQNRIDFFNKGLDNVINQIKPKKIIICSNKKYINLYQDSIFYHIKSFWHGRTERTE